MGWWHPYFFSDTEGVQLLLPDVVLSGPVSLFVGFLLVALLCVADRFLFHRFGFNEPAPAAVLYAVQRLTGGLVMLLMMTFNAPLFAWIICSLGVGEWLATRGSAGNTSPFPRCPPP